MAGDLIDPKPSDERVKLDATGEFFSIGAPLHAVRAGYVRRKADDVIFDTVVAGHYAHVLAPDRSGKSSLIAAAAARLEANGFKVAVLDLEQIGERGGGSDSGRWYYNVAYRLLRQLRIRYDLQAWWQDKSMLSNRQRLVDFYTEVVLQHVPERVVVFFDQIQCIESLPDADQLLASIRVAHNARATDPGFTRLVFVLVGECDPVSLIDEVALSPFNVTQAVVLDDFSRADLNLFATELNLPPAQAKRALDRIYYWTGGHPYLTQKLARAVSRDVSDAGFDEHIDRIATRQIAGRAALHSEPHLSHIHRGIVSDTQRVDALLNLYGKLRKGIEVPADLGSGAQRRLIAVGLTKIDDNGNLKVRNRLYASVFTARWANENLPIRLREPGIVALSILLIALIPFWYTQWLPGPYVRTLTASGTDIDVATRTFESLRSFPGHGNTAEVFYRHYLERRANDAADVTEVREIAHKADGLANAGRLAEEMIARFWDRQVTAAVRVENRDVALLASLESLQMSTPHRRQMVAALVGDDYPNLLATLPITASRSAVFDPTGRTLTTISGTLVSQWSLTPQGVQQREPWTVTALEVRPLVRRVIVNREGSVQRAGLTLNLSHGQLADLRIKVIAPSGRAVEVKPGMRSASSTHDIHIPAQQMQEFIGEPLRGTWSISIRDEALGIAGRLVGWNLKLNSQGAVEHFERGLNIPDPVERNTDNVWFDASGRYAIARTVQSDSARIWDLSLAKPLRAIAVSESETLLGLDANARHLVTATQDRVNLWDTASGDRVATLPVGAASMGAALTRDGKRLFVLQRGDLETRLQLWSLETKNLAAEIVIAGVPGLVAIDSGGDRVAIADFDKAARVWDFMSGELVSQFDLTAQPSELQLSADGEALAVVYARSGFSLWRVDKPRAPLVRQSGEGEWHLEFSPSGRLFVAGRSETGYQLHSSNNGRLLGPPFGMQNEDHDNELLSFSEDERVILTGSRGGPPRFWRATPSSAVDSSIVGNVDHSVWNASADNTVLASPGGSFFAIGDGNGHVHMVSSAAGLSDITAQGNDISFLGHNSGVRILGIDAAGSLVASAAYDNSVRVWQTESGEPMSYVVDVASSIVSDLVFSPDSKYLAVVDASHVSIVDIASGLRIAEFSPGSAISGAVFSAPEKLYVGSENGALTLIETGSDGRWRQQLVWQGQVPIKLLRVSPRGKFLILVDANNVASQFFLSDSRIAANQLQLPASVQDVLIGPGGSSCYFRTPRWVHYATASVSGLHWNDALLAPKALQGSRMISGDAAGKPGVPHRVYVPAAKHAYIELVPLDFPTPATAGIFGSKEELLQEWRLRITGSPANAFPL